MTHPPRRPWTLRRRIGQSFVVVGVLLVVLFAALVVSTVQFVRAGNRVIYRWQPAVSSAARLLTDVVDQQTSLRGFALSHDPAFVTRYDRYVTAERRHTDHLRSLLGADSQLRGRLDLFVSDANRWRHTIARPGFAALRANDPNAVRLIESAAAGQRFDQLQARAAALSAGIRARTDAAGSDRKSYGTVFVVALALSALMFIAGAVAIWRGLHRWVLDPVDRLGKQTREVAGGDTYRQLVPAGSVEFAALGRDVEAMRLQIAGQLARAEEIYEELQVRSEELARSNDDLQQFAYVASHDLSEPLRKVTNFCQLLERQYADQLDDRARQYIDFAVDGAKRMQVLITDLLELSRVGRATDEFVPVDLDVALDAALATLADKIADAGARIERATPLPTVSGDPALLTSLLENLVGNAVKYRREGVPPVIRLSAERGADEPGWTVTVSDNGIGIDPQYADRIFVVFQRLHMRDQYGGTGIGLALCRKIVEFHRGRIWLDDVQSAHGATFRFTLPEDDALAEPHA